MANRRDLHIGITGDSGGFDKAVEEAEAAARGLDRELEKLQREMTAQERVSARAAVAVRKYGDEQDKAALQARKLGMDAQRAAQQAEKAQLRADAAAKAYERGLIDEEKALRAAARAEDATERAAIKAAEAHRAAARAAEEQVQQERKLAREAELAAAAERLGVLKASGQVREHNSLLRDLETKFGDLSKEGSGAFQSIETTGSKAFAAIGESGPGAIALVVAALAAVPFAAVAAEAAVSLGLGGALIGLGLKATEGNKNVKAALAAMKTNVTTEAKDIAAPFEQTWIEIARTAQLTFHALAPELRADFAKLAPAVTDFVHDAGYAVTQLSPAFHAATDAADALLQELGPQLPTIAQNLGHSIEIMASAATRSAPAFANMTVAVSELLPPIAHVIDLAGKVGPVVSPIFGLLAGFGDGFGKAEAAIPPYTSAVAQASGPTQQLAKDMQTLRSATASASDRTDALNDALTRLFDPALAAYEDTARLRQAFDSLSAALKKSHGALNDNSAAAADAKLQFAGLLHDTEQYAKDLTNAGLHLDDVQNRLAPYILALYKAAGANKQARQMVDAFVKTLQLVPPKKGTTLYNNAAQQKKAIEAYQRQINGLHGKTVDIYQVMHLTQTQAYLNQRKNILGYAGGGIVQHLADGGPSGMVTGPGTGTSDSILTALSNGEFVVNARATAANRPVLDAINSGRSVPVAAAVTSGTAGGGEVPGLAAAVSELRAAAANLRNAQVVMDGQPVGQIVSRHLGQQTDQRRRTG